MALFYRIAVMVLSIPPLRERQGDKALLIDHLLEDISSEPGYVRKKLSPSARNALLDHSWPGNIRELKSTLRRASVSSEGNKISADDVKGAFLHTPSARTGSEMLPELPIGEGIDLPSLLEKVKEHYLSAALHEAGGNKTKAAKLIGVSSYQTFTNWMQKSVD